MTVVLRYALFIALVALLIWGVFKLLAYFTRHSERVLEARLKVFDRTGSARADAKIKKIMSKKKKRQ